MHRLSQRPEVRNAPGGYSSFQFDITEYVHAGENTLVVHAVDHQRGGKQPHGKQCDKYHSKGCFYTRTTGIWQTVWLEFVPRMYLKSVQVTTDYRMGSVTFLATVNELPKALTLRTSISFDGKPCASFETPLSAGGTIYTMQVGDVKCWDILQPNLYDVTYELLDAMR